MFAPHNRVNATIRVAVANRPRLMRELIISTMTDQPDIEVVADIENEAEIVGVVQRTTPEFLIIALDAKNPCAPLCDSLLQQFPNMKIVALAPQGSWSVFYWASLNMHAMDLEPSETGLLNALRSSRDQVGRKR